MSEQTPATVPQIIIPPKPDPNYALLDDAVSAIHFLTKFTSSSRLDPELRMELNDIKNTMKTMRTIMIRMTDEAQDNHDRLVEVVRSQRLM